jgi:hypothetical protein
VSKLVVDPEKSRLRIRTFAQGLLARLAHDLELVCRDVSGSAERSSAGTGSAHLEVPIAKIEVAGTLKDGRVDPGGLSPSEREDVLAKMRKDVFHVFHVGGGTNAVVRVEGTLDAGKGRVRIVPPNGRTVEQSIVARVDAEGDHAVRASGSFAMSLEALGSDPVKGPMNAFRVKDTVELLFDLVFTQANG